MTGRELRMENGTVVESDATTVPCGCGDYEIAIPSDTPPESLDVVCPKCGNHFGYAEGDG